MTYLPHGLDDRISRLESLIDGACLPWHAGHLGNAELKCECPYIFDEAHAGGVGQVFIDNELPISDGGNDAPAYADAVNNMHLIVDAVNAIPELIAEIKRLRGLGLQ